LGEGVANSWNTPPLASHHPEIIVFLSPPIPPRARYRFIYTVHFRQIDQTYFEYSKRETFHLYEIHFRLNL